MLKLHFVVLLGLGFFWALKQLTLPETNSSHHLAPENRGPLEKEIPALETIIFGGGNVSFGVLKQLNPGYP